MNELGELGVSFEEEGLNISIIVFLVVVCILDGEGVHDLDLWKLHLLFVCGSLLNQVRSRFHMYLPQGTCSYQCLAGEEVVLQCLECHGPNTICWKFIRSLEF